MDCNRSKVRIDLFDADSAGLVTSMLLTYNLGRDIVFELKILSHFAAAHQLKMVGEKCENLHGHNWKVEVTVSGEELNSAGVLIDFGILKDCLREVMADLDHKFLNEIPAFKGTAPSSECIAVYIARTLQEKIDENDIRVSRVTAWESENASATYLPPATA